MQDQARHPGRTRVLAEFFVFAALAGVTIGSAISAKENAGVAPALTRLTDAPAQREAALATIAARPGEANRAPAFDPTVIDPAPSPVEGAGDAPVVAADLSPGETLVDPEIRYFNGRPIRPARTIWMTVTAYSPDAKSCGIWADGVTASNKSIWTNAMKLVAADTSMLPFGSLLSVPGYDNGAVVPVLDRGGAIKGNRLDVLYPTHEIALQWGVQRLPITVWEYAD